MGALSGITSILSPILTTAGVPAAVGGFATQLLNQQIARDQLKREQNQALQQLQERQKVDEAAAENSTRLQKLSIEAEAAANEDRRRLALRRAVARQKTLFSAQGLGGGNDGSSEAVLLGLINDSENQAASDAVLGDLRKSALDQNVAAQKQKNLLQLTQLGQRQNLTNYLSGYY